MQRITITIERIVEPARKGMNDFENVKFDDVWERLLFKLADQQEVHPTGSTTACSIHKKPTRLRIHFETISLPKIRATSQTVRLSKQF